MPAATSLTLSLRQVAVIVVTLLSGAVATAAWVDSRIDARAKKHDERPHMGAVTLVQYRDDHAEIMDELGEIRKILEDRR